MTPIPHQATTPISGAIVLTVAFLSFVYVRGWNRISGVGAKAIRSWRLASFLCGVLLIWAALCSPLVVYEHDFLTMHMIQHLLLMTFAPALVLLGEPFKALRYGWPQVGTSLLQQMFQQPRMRLVGGAVSHPAFCWTVSALTLLGWHVPALFALGMQSQLWHSFEQASFLVAGFFFWWPVVRPWPSVSNTLEWSTLLYLFLATLPCDILSGFLVFSDRVAYPVYLSGHRRNGFSVLQDQQCAAALMWTCVTLVYLVPAAILSVKLLSPRNVNDNELAQLEAHPPAVVQSEPQTVEAV